MREPKFDVKDVKSDLLQRYHFRLAKQYLLFISQSFSFNYPMETLGGHEIKLIEFINSENLLLFEMCFRFCSAAVNEDIMRFIVIANYIWGFNQVFMS